MTVAPEVTELAQETSQQCLPSDLQELLSQFFELFAPPMSLPPQRLLHDHKISLVDETQLIKIRPYRYPTVQKDEIER